MLPSSIVRLPCPQGMKLWTSQQWANDARPCVWNTRIVEYQIAPAKASAAKEAKPKRHTP